MSLADGKAQLKTSLQTLRAVDDEDYDQAIDDFLDALETWIKGAKVTFGIGSITVDPGTHSNTVPSIEDNALS